MDPFDVGGVEGLDVAHGGVDLDLILQPVVPDPRHEGRDPLQEAVRDDADTGVQTGEGVDALASLLRRRVVRAEPGHDVDDEPTTDAVQPVGDRSEHQRVRGVEALVEQELAEAAAELVVGDGLLVALLRLPGLPGGAAGPQVPLLVEDSLRCPGPAAQVVVSGLLLACTARGALPARLLLLQQADGGVVTALPGDDPVVALALPVVHEGEPIDLAKVEELAILHELGHQLLGDHHVSFALSRCVHIHACLLCLSAPMEMGMCDSFVIAK